MPNKAMETLKAIKKIPSGSRHVVQTAFDEASNLQELREIMRQKFP